MIERFRARAPLRLGLAGGGTDVSPYCDQFGGQVLNATINHYAHATIEPNDRQVVEFHAQDLGVTECHPAEASIPADAGLVLHREVYNVIVERFRGGNPLPLRLYTRSDAPPGSGLGASSTMVVAIVMAFAEWLRLPLGEYDVACLAYEVERIRLGQTGGRQDQYAATFGGVNFMEFSGDDRVTVNPLRIKPWILNELESSVVLFFTSVSRESASIIERQKRQVQENHDDAVRATHHLKEDAMRMKEALLKGDICGVARILNESWAAKRHLAAGISTPEIENLMSFARKGGAVAGKVSGAGGGGFVMLMVEPRNRLQLERALQTRKGRLLPFRFSTEGGESWSVPW